MLTSLKVILVLIITKIFVKLLMLSFSSHILKDNDGLGRQRVVKVINKTGPPKF